MQNDEFFETDFVLTGSHLEKQFGNTQTDADRDGIKVSARIAIPMEADSKADMAQSTAGAISEFADYFRNNKYDLLIVLGDRFEIFGVASAAALIGIPIAHLYGGDTTEGAVDEFLRHSITKMSYLHFTSCEVYRKRVIQLGEDPDRVENVGSMGVENCLKLELLTFEELNNQIHNLYQQYKNNTIEEFSIEKERYAVVTFHPVTQENSAKDQMYELIAAMDDMKDMKYIITLSNADAGGREINQIWLDEGKKHNNWLVVSSLGAVRYLSALKYSAFMLGNSSSGISEAPSMKIPTVNIGDRQKGRVMADSLICCGTTKDEIIKAMNKAMETDFRNKVKMVESPFGDGNTSDKIIAKIKAEFKRGQINLKKKFYDIDFEY